MSRNPRLPQVTRTSHYCHLLESKHLSSSCTRKTSKGCTHLKSKFSNNWRRKLTMLVGLLERYHLHIILNPNDVVLNFNVNTCTHYEWPWLTSIPMGCRLTSSSIITWFMGVFGLVFMFLRLLPSRFTQRYLCK